VRGFGPIDSNVCSILFLQCHGIYLACRGKVSIIEVEKEELKTYHKFFDTLNDTYVPK
jgi:hypothetical protein